MVSRALTTFTVGFLLLDALLLAYSGFALGRRMLVFWAAVCLVAAVLVVLGWRRSRRVMSDVGRARRVRRGMSDLKGARREMRSEVESIRQLLHGKHLDN